MMLLTGKRNNRGFLLLEVMVSVAILSVAFVLILNSFTRSLRAIELSEDYFRAGLLLEQKLLEISASDAEEGSSEGTFIDFNNRFSWSLDVVRLKEDSIREANVKISWNKGSREHGISILTYL